MAGMASGGTVRGRGVVRAGQEDAKMERVGGKGWVKNMGRTRIKSTSGNGLWFLA